MSSSRGQMWATAAYATMVLGAVALFLLIRSYGESLSPPAVPASSVAGPAAAASEILRHLLLALTAVIVAGRCLGSLFRLIGQPPVIGEVVAGILLGPSLLGRIAPEAYLFILPPEIAPFLGVLAQLGVDPLHVPGWPRAEPGSAARSGPRHRCDLARQHRAAVHARLGAGAVPVPACSRPPACRSRTSRCSSGIAMSITAFPGAGADPVRSGDDARRRLGVLALTCAAVDDVTAWCLLAFVVGVVNATGESALLVAILTLAFIAAMFLAVRPLFRRACWRRPPASKPTQGAVAIALVAHAGVGAGDRSHRHPRDLRRVPARCRDPARQRAGTHR